MFKSKNPGTSLGKRMVKAFAAAEGILERTLRYAFPGLSNCKSAGREERERRGVEGGGGKARGALTFPTIAL